MSARFRMLTAALVSVAATFVAAPSALSQVILGGAGQPFPSQVSLGHIEHILEPRGTVVTTSAPDVGALIPSLLGYENDPYFEARGAGLTTLRAVRNGAVLAEAIVQVVAPDAIWYEPFRIAQAAGPPSIHLLAHGRLSMRVVCAANGTPLHGAPPDLVFAIGDTSYAAGDFYSIGQFVNVGLSSTPATYESVFRSSSWTLPGPLVHVHSADEVTVEFEFVEDRGSNIVRVRPTLDDGTEVLGAVVAEPSRGFGSTATTLDGTGYYFTPDRDERTTFRFLVGSEEHSVVVSGTRVIVTEGSTTCAVRAHVGDRPASLAIGLCVLVCLVPFVRRRGA